MTLKEQLEKVEQEMKKNEEKRKDLLEKRKKLLGEIELETARNEAEKNRKVHGQQHIANLWNLSCQKGKYQAQRKKQGTDGQLFCGSSHKNLVNFVLQKG